jgi:predicted branched-subunit amino acid permease
MYDKVLDVCEKIVISFILFAGAAGFIIALLAGHALA